ncbi:MAG: PAS domain-containing sensor histidine kinase, partial [Halobacteria archaeon]|nr:PAS domain-containing sensor histidine kinase [Halobacteria archaeon]
GVVCVVRDITERKERENELEKYETIVEKSSDAVFIHDRMGGIEKVNRKACESLGYERDDLLGMTVFDIEEDLEREALLELWDEMETGDERTLEGAHTRADGSSFPVEVRLNKIEIDGDERFLALVRDITERKERERQLRKQNERLEEFASLVSHDLRDPLNSARAQVALIRNEIDDSEPDTLDSRRLDSLDEVHDRMEEIIEDVLTLTRKGKTVGEMDEVPLEETVDEAWSTSETESAVLEKEDLGTVLADDERLRTVFENLFSNSVRHVGDDVTVRVGRLDGGNGFFVEDDGHGIPEGERDKVFDHGYTSSEEGTGLGLSIVRSVAEA